MIKKSLALVLRSQWWLHTLLTSVFFITVSFFFLFSMEDYFHEKQLIDLSNIVAVNGAIDGIPAHIQVYALSEAPQNWRTQLEQVEMNDAIEIDNLNGDAIHLIRSEYDKSKDEFILAFDTSKTQGIWEIIDKLLLMIMPWMVIFLAMASFMAKKFIQQIQGHFKHLLVIIEQSESPETLTTFSKGQSIKELAQFAQLFAQVWQQKIEILVREKQSLEYLSHELRTPIQSSLATLELLAIKTKDHKTIDRLIRSLNRMTRLSNAILYLMESETPQSIYPVDVENICRLLVDELAPLAEVKKQSFIIYSVGGNQVNTIDTDESIAKINSCKMSTNAIKPIQIIATQEVIETLLSILLTNALQHSNCNPIVINITHECIRIENEIKPLSETLEQQFSSDKKNLPQSFGIGLTIAQRLAKKFNLQLEIKFDQHDKVVAVIEN